MIVVSSTTSEDLRHLADHRDDPSCGVKPEGAFVVARLQDVTCPTCIAVSNYPRVRVARGGQS